MFVQLVGFISPRMYVRLSVDRDRTCSLNVRNQFLGGILTFLHNHLLAQLQIVAEIGPIEDRRIFIDFH